MKEPNKKIVTVKEAKAKYPWGDGKTVYEGVVFGGEPRYVEGEKQLITVTTKDEGQFVWIRDRIGVVAEEREVQFK